MGHAADVLPQTCTITARRSGDSFRAGMMHASRRCALFSMKQMALLSVYQVPQTPYFG